MRKMCVQQPQRKDICLLSVFLWDSGASGIVVINHLGIFPPLPAREKTESEEEKARRRRNWYWIDMRSACMNKKMGCSLSLVTWRERSDKSRQVEKKMNCCVSCFGFFHLLSLCGFVTEGNKIEKKTCRTNKDDYRLLKGMTSTDVTWMPGFHLCVH